MPKIAGSGGGFIVRMFEHLFHTPKKAPRPGPGPAPLAPRPNAPGPAMPPRTPGPAPLAPGPGGGTGMPGRTPGPPPAPRQPGRLPRGETVPEATRNSNPRFNQGNEYQVNCTNCVVAAEHRMRGLDVTARGRAGGRTGDPAIGWQGPDGQPVQHHPVGDLAESAKQFPDGSRGSMYGQWKNQNMGHIWSWERRDGGLQLFDPQTGDPDVRKYLPHLEPGSVHMYRTDDASWVGNPDDWMEY